MIQASGTPGPSSRAFRPIDAYVRATLIGESPPFERMMECIRRCAPCDAAVLIQGETGTGKELAARVIHYLGPRQDQPFVPVNCGAVPEGLIESELFGHERGAFTDAKRAQPGLVAQADGGSLFLDEVESLSPKGQVALLRFLQDRVYRPLGGRRPLEGDVRIIAASNQDLKDLVRSGGFREDLLYRLDVLSLTMPPLRERGRDVLLLAEHLIRRFAERYNLPEPYLDMDSRVRLLAHDWPGNVRELENLIQRELLMSDGSLLRINPGSPDRASASGDVSRQGGELPLSLGFQRAKQLAVETFERDFLTRALEQSGGNVSLAARLVGKERRAFGKLIKKHGILSDTLQAKGPDPSAGGGA